MKRKVVAVKFYSPDSAPNGTGSNWLTLDCGHHKSQKASIRVPKKTECRQCQMDSELYDEVRNTKRSDQ